MKQALRYALLLLFLSYCAGPVVWQFITSIKPDAEIARLPPLLPSHPTSSHYASVFENYPFLRIMANSAIVACSSTLMSLVLGTLCAFALAKLRMRYTLPILGFILSASMFPAIATVSPLYIIIRALGLRDTLLALIVTYTTFSLPLSIWILMNFFKAVPDEIYLAARVDGCTPFQAFYRIMLPLSIPGITTTAILVFIFCWNEFLFALTFTSTPASRTIPVAIALFPGLHEVPWGDIAAATIIVIIPALVLVFGFQRRIIEGLTAGAVKG
ncbi:MAG: Trehalose transport system permease protein SugB [Syntrophorhabdaceae bacterium PtaU1.Bin034]|nr:MAG: Trehalose transport system permease protein SugB [Syntrophorhabdaceae bacterium PtaU1.Bin034]